MLLLAAAAVAFLLKRYSKVLRSSKATGYLLSYSLVFLFSFLITLFHYLYSFLELLDNLFEDIQVLNVP